MSAPSPATDFGAPPPAPGTLGAPIDTQTLLRYLSALHQWFERLRRELTEIDACVQHLPDQSQYTNDVVVAMTVVEGLAKQLQRITVTWDSGRVGARETTAISGLLWGRLDGNANATLAVSFVEACSLGAALVRTLRERLDGSGATLNARLARAGARAQEVRDLAARCRDKIAQAPNLAVPDPAALGPVPTDVEQYGAYAHKLDQVDRALDTAALQFSAALGRREELRAVMGAYLDMAGERGVAESPDVVAAEQAARTELWSAPCDLARADTLVAALQTAVHAATHQRETA